MAQQIPEQAPVPYDPKQPPPGVEVITHGRKLHMYSVTDNELEALQESGLSATIDVALFTLSFGVFVTLIITISTVEISSAKLFAGYIAACIVTFFAVLYFGLRSRIAWRNAKAKLKWIKNSK